ncbi:MAG: transporter [Pseudomonadota bacterium]|uniref:transporter n=1 Tax=Phenylobacterium sp. TaxID=1871053 RepID=UPI0025E2B569|nr:transporter [Phenylobacterium sp.]MBT9470454.1 transporter [Phenylobacterium sp.]
MRRPAVRILAGAALASLSLAAAQAQGAPERRDFCADRPGKGSPSCVIDPGVFQAEVGAFDASFQRSGPGSSDTYAIGELELRLGLTPTTEGQIAWTPYTQVRDRSGGQSVRTEGVGDVTFALRRSLKNPDGSGVSVALQPFVSAPTGKSGIGAGAWQGGLIAPISVPLSADISLALAPEFDVVADADGHGSHLGWVGVVGISRSFGALSLGAELWAAVDDDPAERTTQASFDLTLAWTPVDDLQFDFGVNAGLTRDTPDLQVGAGIARRF